MADKRSWKLFRFAGVVVAGLAWLAGTALAAQIVVPAAMGGNVADADEDGLGDEHNNLPGPSPAVGSAGVNQVGGGAGANGTMRFHIEFPLAGFAPPIGSARVRLTTYLGAIDSLDTFFWAATADGNGTLDDTDFETPAMPIAGVVMPVSGAGEFELDVTDEVESALALGRSYFVLQARSDESLVAGTELARGLQIRTTATSNSADELPQLIVGQPPSVVEVPTLGELGSAVLALLLMTAGVRSVRHLRRS